MLIAFGLGSILCSVTKLAAGDARDIILNIFKVISICSQLVFFCYYSGDAPQTTPSAGYDYSIACLIGLQAWTWVSKVLKSLWPGESHSVSQNQGLALTEEYFEPFDVEFTTIAIGSLFDIWHSKNQQEGTLEEHTDDTGYGLPSVQLPYEPLLERSQTIDVGGTRFRQRRKVIFAIGILTVLYLTVDLMAVEGPSIFNGLANVYIVRGVILLYFIPLSVVVVMALLNLQCAEFTTRPTFLNGGEYVLLFTACGESSYFVLRGIAGIGCLVSGCNTNHTSIPAEDICPSDQAFLTHPAPADDSYQVNSYLAIFWLSYAVIMFLQVWLQSLFLIIVKRKQLTTTWIRTLLIWMSVLNFFNMAGVLASFWFENQKETLSYASHGRVFW